MVECVWYHASIGHWPRRCQSSVVPIGPIGRHILCERIRQFTFMNIILRVAVIGRTTSAPFARFKLTFCVCTTHIFHLGLAEDNWMHRRVMVHLAPAFFHFDRQLCHSEELSPYWPTSLQCLWSAPRRGKFHRRTTSVGQFGIQHACDSFVNEIEIVKLMLDAHAKTHNINHKMKRPNTPCTHHTHSLYWMEQLAANSIRYLTISINKQSVAASHDDRHPFGSPKIKPINSRFVSAFVHPPTAVSLVQNI